MAVRPAAARRDMCVFCGTSRDERGVGHDRRRPAESARGVAA